MVVLLALLLFLANVGKIQERNEQCIWRRSLTLTVLSSWLFSVCNPICMIFACPKISVFVLQINNFTHEYLHGTVGQPKKLFARNYESPIILQRSGSVK